MSRRFRRLARAFPGAGADTPAGIPMRGWVQILKRAWAETQRDMILLLAAGVAFYGFLSLFPAMIAAVTVWGLVAEPETVAEQAEWVTQVLPPDAASLVTGQMEAIIGQPQRSMGLGLVVALALALWSASAGVTNLIQALNVAYDEEETRSFVRRKLLALGMTLGAVLFAVVAIGLIAVVPLLLEHVLPSGGVSVIVQIGRWVGLVVGLIAALAVLYRWAPDRSAPRLSWVSVGAVSGTVVWVLASAGFSLYASNFASYSKTYGALAGVAVLMLWLWITALIVLVGAEINAEAEQQTIRDSTTGPPEPLGERGAVKADTRPDEEPVDAGPGAGVAR